jgi:DNA-nicking Smr family endonuclease
VKLKRDDEDSRLFHEAMRDVKPLAHDRHVAKGRKPAPRARFARRSGRVVIEDPVPGETSNPIVSGADDVSFRRPGIQTNVLRKLRRGEYRVQAEIDLHGLTADEATSALHSFLIEAIARGLRTVCVIHGKGLRAGGQAPVLKNAVISALRRTSVVMGFVSARREDGGTGAVYVLLRG